MPRKRREPQVAHIPFDYPALLERSRRLIRQRREAAGISQAELGAMVGVKHNTISALECGRPSVSFRTFLHVMAVLHIPLAHAFPPTRPSLLQDVIDLLHQMPESMLESLQTLLRQYQRTVTPSNSPPSAGVCCVS